MSSPEMRAWALHLAPRLGSVARLYLPGSAIDARRRELLGAVVSGALDVGSLVGLHAAWLEVLGPAELDDVDDEVMAWAAGAAVCAHPYQVEDPAVPLDEPSRQALFTGVAHAVVVARTLNSARSVLDRVVGRQARSVTGLASDLADVALGAPVSIPLMAAAGAVGTLGRVIPDPPTVVVDPEPDLLTQLLAEAMPTWLGGISGRLLVAALPVPVPVAWRSGESGATARVGRGVVQIENGLAADAWALIDGDVDSLVRAGSRTLSREVRAAGAQA